MACSVQYFSWWLGWLFIMSHRMWVPPLLQSREGQLGGEGSAPLSLPPEALHTSCCHWISAFYSWRKWGSRCQGGSPELAQPSVWAEPKSKPVRLQVRLLSIILHVSSPALTFKHWRCVDLRRPGRRTCWIGTPAGTLSGVWIVVECETQRVSWESCRLWSQETEAGDTASLCTSCEPRFPYL
jgi:hypothetical protein